MLTLTDIRKGKVIVWDGEPYTVVSAEFLRKQQRRPVVRTTLKHLRTGQTKEHSFQQSDKVPEADVERVPYQFLFKATDAYTFMNGQTYEQLEIKDEILGDVVDYLTEGQEVDVLLFEGNPVSATLPIKIDRKVIEAPPGVRGDTSTNVMKDVVIEGGKKMKAPLFVSEGDMIRIDTRSGEYLGRASE